MKLIFRVSVIKQWQKLFCRHCLGNCHSNVNRGTDHRVVTHTDQAHHFDVSRNAGRTGELGITMHTAHGIGHAVAGGTGSHVVRVQGTTGTAAGSDAEVFAAVFDRSEERRVGKEV